MIRESSEINIIKEQAHKKNRIWEPSEFANFMATSTFGRRWVPNNEIVLEIPWLR
jgi:hypothetical protein